MPFIREETPNDHPAIREVNKLAFNGDDEAEIVDRLRAVGLSIVSLVAIENDQVVGHILFSELPIETAHGVIEAVSLAPMCVHPDWQRRGIGTALVRRGLELCAARGKTIVVVVGHPAYYPRFGFSAALAKKLRSPFSGDIWMALELKPGALDGVEGIVRYPAAFGDLDDAH